MNRRIWRKKQMHSIVSAMSDDVIRVDCTERVSVWGEAKRGEEIWKMRKMMEWWRSCLSNYTARSQQQVVRGCCIQPRRMTTSAAAVDGGISISCQWPGSRSAPAGSRDCSVTSPRHGRALFCCFRGRKPSVLGRSLSAFSWCSSLIGRAAHMIQRPFYCHSCSK